jgi:hypothetical protein
MRSFLSGSINFSDTWKMKMAVYHLKNKIWLKVLEKHWKFSQLWLEIINEMKYVIELSDQYFLKLNLSKEELIQVQKSVKEHFLSVNNNYVNLQY